MGTKKKSVSSSLAFILLAAGAGKRMSSATLKQFIQIGVKKLFQYSLDLFIKFAEKQKNIRTEIVLVIPEEKLNFFREHYNQYKKDIQSQVLKVVAGGSTRAESVYLGTREIEINSNSLVIVHDSARPLLTMSQLEAFWESLNKISTGNFLLCGRWAKDTLLWSSLNKLAIVDFLDRTRVFQAETPQGFYLSDYREARKQIQSPNWTGLPFFQFTDESSVFLAVRKKVIPFVLSGINLKITNNEDLGILESYLKRRL